MVGRPRQMLIKRLRDVVELIGLYAHIFNFLYHTEGAKADYMYQYYVSGSLGPKICSFFFFIYALAFFPELSASLAFPSRAD